MIRKLTEHDRQKVLEYLYKEATYNIFIIGDIETFGFESEFQTVYAEFYKNEIISVQLFYNEHAIYYSHLNYFNIEYLDIYKNHTFNYISGKESLMLLVQPHIDSNFSFNSMYFCQAESLKTEVNIKNTVQRITSDIGIEKLYHLLAQIKEFGTHHQSFEDFKKSTLKGLKMGVKLFIEKDNNIVSTVATTAETTINAMVVGVATDPRYRNKGYASQLMVALMKEYFENRKKSLCLFYNNPKAGKIYKRLGFKDIGKWVMMSDIEG